MITGYKGSSTEITVPEMIGKCRVTEIGPLAFAPYGPRVKESVRAFRRTITKIILPAGIRVIGVSAFRVKDAQCAENAPALFLNCDNVTVRIPALLPARIYCEKFGLHYEYNGGEQ